MTLVEYEEMDKNDMKGIEMYVRGQKSDDDVVEPDPPKQPQSIRIDRETSELIFPAMFASDNGFDNTRSKLFSYLLVPDITDPDPVEPQWFQNIMTKRKFHIDRFNASLIAQTQIDDSNEPPHDAHELLLAVLEKTGYDVKPTEFVKKAILLYPSLSVSKTTKQIRSKN